ncbi:MAG TPA: glycosyl hydrolase, partial [Anaerolineae bacterium]|nr:glycosyl hydrolase [Anaerolineae bacterium]
TATATATLTSTPSATPTVTPTPTHTPTATPTVTPTTQVICWQGQAGGEDDDTTVALVSPAENQPYRLEVRMGTRSWPERYQNANGLRFRGVPLPPLARITSAHLSLRYTYHTGLPVNLHLYGEAVDVSLPFADYHALVHLRPRTTAEVAWNIDAAPAAASWFDSPDITQIVQEVVNRPGWTLYNPLSILVESDVSTNHYLDAWAYDVDPGLAPKIEICYQSGGEPYPTATPTVTRPYTPPTATPTATRPASGPTATPTATRQTSGPTATPTATRTTTAPPTPPRPPGPGTKQGLQWLYGTSPQKMAAAGAKAVMHWGYNASAATSALNAGLKYFPVQFNCNQGEASVNESTIRSFVGASSRFKGLTWLAFNEPDKSDQSNCTPQQAARAFRKLDQVLRSGPNPADPTAKLYCCGLVDTGGWKNYMSDFRTAYLNTYGQNPPINGVHLHLYNNTAMRHDWCRLRDELDDFRNWQQGQGWLANRSIIVSEYGVLSSSGKYPGDRAVISGNCAPGCECDFLAGLFDVFQRRSWVQYHLWWATYSDAGAAPPGETWDNGNIFTNKNGSQVTSPVGVRYRTLSGR